MDWASSSFSTLPSASLHRKSSLQFARSRKQNEIPAQTLKQMIPATYDRLGVKVDRDIYKQLLTGIALVRVQEWRDIAPIIDTP